MRRLRANVFAGHGSTETKVDFMHIAIRRICVPTDFSEAADLAVHYAAALAEHHGAGLHVLHVLEHAADLVHHPDFSGTGEVAHAYFERLEREEDFERLEREVGWEQESDSKREDADASVHQFFETLKDSANRELEAVGHEW